MSRSINRICIICGALLLVSFLANLVLYIALQLSGSAFVSSIPGNSFRHFIAVSLLFFVGSSVMFEDSKEIYLALESDLALKQTFVKEMHTEILDLQTQISSLKNQKRQLDIEIQDVETRKLNILNSLEILNSNFTPKLLPPIYVSRKWIEIATDTFNADCTFSSCFQFSFCPLFSSLKAFIPSFETIGHYKISSKAESCVNLTILDPSIKTNMPFVNSTGNDIVVFFNSNPTNFLPTKVLVGSSNFSNFKFRKNYDFYLTTPATCPKKIEISPLFPVNRKYFFSLFKYEGSDLVARRAFELLSATRPALNDSIAYVSSFGCDERLFYSLFTILIADDSHHLESQFLSNSLYSGSIPVVLSTSSRELPFHEVIEWDKIAIVLPVQRVTEIYYLLKSIAMDDLVQYKMEARRIFNLYFSSNISVIRGVLDSLSKRLKLPPPILPDVTVSSAYSPKHYAPTEHFDLVPYIENGMEIEMDENLGPVEPSFSNDLYIHNFTQNLRCSNLQFLTPSTPFLQRPFPHDIILRRENLNGFTFRPLGNGLGGSGRDMSQSLGGNHPSEQFTIVILTRGGDRLKILIDIIKRFKNLPYLNKVIVVWNPADNDSLPSDLKWPELSVPIFVAKMLKNSLNNRFLPLKEINTDAVLSMDDDMFLRSDEIIFAFRVWRENRARLVGFPSRSHGWNDTSQQWVYLSGYTCEYSLVLTGAAFIHKVVLFCSCFVLFMLLFSLAVLFLLVHLRHACRNTQQSRRAQEL